MHRALRSAGRPIRLAVPLLVASGATSRAAGMPQLDLANPLTLWQVVWGALVFGLLYVVLSRSALPQVASVLEDRQGRIDADLDAAHAAKSEADRALSELRSTRRKAAAEAQANLDRVTKESREAAAERARETAARLDARLAEAERQIAAERSRAMGAVRAIVRDTAHVLVTRVTGGPVSEGLLDSRIDIALAGTAPPSNAAADGSA